VIVTGVEAVTVLVVTVNVAVVAPVATVTLAGTVAAAELSDRVTTAPPVGAALVSVTVPVEEAPPVTLVGLIVTADRLDDAATGVTVNVAVRVVPPNDPVIVTGVEAVTVLVVTVNVAVVAPAATVTLAGTVAAVELPDSVTTAPPAGAGVFSVTVPVEEAPPTTEVGLTLTADSAVGVKRRVLENGPNTPAALCARTRHHKRCAGRPDSVTCDTVTMGFTVNGAAMVEVVSTWTS
jgi:hypothetical protein